MMKKNRVGHMKVKSIYIKKRKRVGHMKVRVFKREREKDSPCPKKEREREREFMKRVHTLSMQKYSHTCTS